ncbi:MULTISPECIES: hypothetical protein [unclassified Streptomyces]|jgi:hypothetical protein|uniref:Uncharacterized protein n=1 Tax=Streptomyces sp. 900105755 TaxID=3154389 RepID=A0ABV1TFA4_9ACTN
MIPAMPAASAASSRTAPVDALRVLLMGAVAVLILVAGVWGSWGTAQDVMLTKGKERGTVTVSVCGADTCTGPFAPASAGASRRASVVLDKSVGVRKGQTYDVIVKPGTGDVVRSGPAGVLYAWVPLGGALLLASVVVAGGLRLRRVAWVLGVCGFALLTAAFAALQ